jgi:hypothetical protein
MRIIANDQKILLNDVVTMLKFLSPLFGDTVLTAPSEWNKEYGTPQDVLHLPEIGEAG